MPRVVPIEAKFRRLPPVVCYLLARNGGRGHQARHMGMEALVERCTLAADRVHALSWLTSWDQVAFGEIMPFARACGIDFDNAVSFNQATKLVCSQPPFFPYLRHDIARYRVEFEPRIQIYVNHLRELQQN